MHFDVKVFAGTGDQGDADGPAEKATFNNAAWIAVSPQDVVYVTEPFFNGIRKIESGIVSTLNNRQEGNADGPSASASFRGPSGIALDKEGNVFVADQSNHRIRQISSSGFVSTIAGPSGPELFRGWADGLADAALFTLPLGITIDASESTLYVTEHNRVRCVPLRLDSVAGRGSKSVRTVAAVGIAGYADGAPTLAQFDGPLGIAVSQTGDLFVADTENAQVRRVSTGGVVTTVARRACSFMRPTGIALDSSGVVWIADKKRLFLYSPITDRIVTACSDVENEHPIEFQNLSGIAIGKSDIFVLDSNKVLKLAPQI